MFKRSTLIDMQILDHEYSYDIYKLLLKEEGISLLTLQPISVVDVKFGNGMIFKLIKLMMLDKT